jgi:DNA replication protein DnaC
MANDTPRPPSAENSPSLTESSQNFDAIQTIRRAAAIAREKQNTAAHKSKPIGTSDLTSAFEKLALTSPNPVYAHEKKIDRMGLWNAAGVPKRYAEANLSDLVGLPDDVLPHFSRVAGRIMALIDRPGIVAMVGKRGTGKTWLSIGLVREFVRAGKTAIYREATDYFLAIKDTYSSASTRSQTAVESDHLRPALLVIDAVENRSNTEWENIMLIRLVCKRYSENRATVLISNDTEAAFKSHVGESITDRIFDGGGMVVCDWPSLRGRIIKKAET